MRKTFFLLLTICSAAFLLLLLAPANVAQRKPAGNVLRSLRVSTQEQSLSSDSDRPEPGSEMVHPLLTVRVEQPEIEIPYVEIREPQIEIEAPHVEIPEPGIRIEPDHDNFDFDFTGHHERDLNVREQETIQKSFSMPSAHRSLEIDNVWGSIEVVGTASDTVQLTINKSTRAESKERLEQARKDVTLDITQQPDSLKLYVNGPFRCDCHDCSGHREFEGYIVKMDFQVQVPRNIDLKIKTVNEGRVSVRDISGSFLVRNVNGDIQMRNIAGSGTTRTVNGPVKVSFAQNPKEASEFQTVNGNVELQFARDLSADFRFKTMNGGIYSDFPVTAMPVKAVQEEHRGMKTIFRADRYTSARVKAGGPEIKVENLNGDIRILENHE